MLQTKFLPIASGCSGICRRTVSPLYARARNPVRLRWAEQSMPGQSLPVFAWFLTGNRILFSPRGGVLYASKTHSFGFLLCLALWLVVLAAQALTLGTEKSLFPYRTEQVACVEFQNGTTGARHLDKAQRVIQDVMDHLHRFSPDAAVPNQWEGWTYGITLHLKDGQTCMLTLHPAAQAEGYGAAVDLNGTRYFSRETAFPLTWLEESFSSVMAPSR